MIAKVRFSLYKPHYLSTKQLINAFYDKNIIYQSIQCHLQNYKFLSYCTYGMKFDVNHLSLVLTKLKLSYKCDKFSFYQRLLQYFTPKFTRWENPMLHKFLLSIAGIYGAYITMSLITQKMYNQQYESIDPNLPPAQFKYPSVIIWFGAMLCAIAGTIISYFKKEKPNPIPFKEKLILAALFSGNILTTNYSLLYISYPVQVIGRNIRFLFVVIIGAFFSRVKHAHAHLKLGKHKIIMAIVITAGVLLFNYAKESKKDKASHHNIEYQWFGYTLLAASVICDALFSDSQAYSKGNFKPTANQLFTTTNLYGFLFILAFSIFGDQTLLPALRFFRDYPSVLYDLFLGSILQVVGQICIYYVVANFKQHVFPMISTTRKMITVIASIFYFGHYINEWQWVSIVIVFLGMFYELYEELTHQKQREDDAAKKKQEVPAEESSDEDAASPKKAQKKD